MKRKELDVLQQKPVEELKRELREGRERLRALRFDLAAGKVKNVAELRALRKNLARIMTLLSSSGGAKQ